MDVVRKDVELLVEKELGAANKRKPLFNSSHEGYAVILEEFEESKECIEYIGIDLNCLWDCVKNDNVNDFDTFERLNRIKINSISLAVEAIQVAAMAQKFIDSKDKF